MGRPKKEKVLSIKEVVELDARERFELENVRELRGGEDLPVKLVLEVLLDELSK